MLYRRNPTLRVIDVTDITDGGDYHHHRRRTEEDLYRQCSFTLRRSEWESSLGCCWPAYSRYFQSKEKKWRVECSFECSFFLYMQHQSGERRRRRHAEKPIWNEGVCWFENENPVNFSPFFFFFSISFLAADDELTDKLLKRKGTKVRCFHRNINWAPADSPSESHR